MGHRLLIVYLISLLCSSLSNRIVQNKAYTTQCTLYLRVDM